MVIGFFQAETFHLRDPRAVVTGSLELQSYHSVIAYFGYNVQNSAYFELTADDVDDHVHP